MMRLAEYSREKLAELRAATGIAYDGRTQGTLQLFRKASQLEAAAKDIDILERFGVPFELLDAKGCIAVEPGLANAKVAFVGGLRLPRDETGDCFKFTHALATLAARRQVSFRFDTDVLGLTTSRDRIEAVRTNRGEVRADAVVVALGSFSAALVRPLGLRLPIYPVKGYSITAPIRAFDRSPQSTIMDESYKVAITRLGDRIRVGGMAEVGGYGLDLDPRRRTTLEYSLQSLFPAAGDLEGVSFWTGLRPMTPDGTPVVGSTPIANLFLNTGHGTLGWTMACGSGRLIADIISADEPEIESEDLGVCRYGR
jgi:D-amino-acid dehydrogenase